MRWISPPAAIAGPQSVLTIAPLQAAPGTTHLWGIACPTSTTCYAVGQSTSGGVVVPITGGTVGYLQTAGATSLRGIACSSSTTCYAVGDNSTSGVVATITIGAGGGSGGGGGGGGSGAGGGTGGVTGCPQCKSGPGGYGIPTS